MTYFRKKTFQVSAEPFLFCTQKPNLGRNPSKNRKMPLQKYS
jgi:hypothetical protein